MKKLFCTFLMLFISVFAHANIHIDGDVAKQVILSHIDTTYQAAALEEYNNQLESSGDYTMSASGLYKVCIASGWDIKTPDGKTKCDSFVKALIDGGSYTYYAVCGPDKGKSGGTERCVDNVFYALVNGIDVQIGQAIELSKEYALVKYNDDIECSNKSRPGTVNPKNDYVKCTSKLTPTYYEFKFDDVNQSTNTEIYKDTIRAVGNIHGVAYKTSGGIIDTITLERLMNTSCAVGYDTTDTATCEKLNKSLSRFGLKSEVRNVTCASLNDVQRFCAVSFTSNKCTAAKEYGIDNTIFKDIQYPLSPTLENYVKDYVYTQLKAKNIHPASFSCDKMPKRLDKAVAGMHVSDGYTLTCHIDDKCIDFVFEDLSESANYSKNAALSRLACLKHGGAADDKNCRGLDESQCTELGEKIKSNGQFTGTHYDRVRGGCILNGAVAERHINLLGEIAAGVALTLVTDGAATIPVVVSIGTDIAFEAVMDWQRKIPYNDYKDFIQQVLNCSEDSNGSLSDAIRISGIKSVENKYCLSETIRENYQLVVGQIDKLAPEDQKILADVFSNIVENIGDSEYIRKASESDISLIKKARNYASGALLAGLFFFQPEKMMSKFDDVARDIARLRYGASKNFSQYLDDFKNGRAIIKFPMERLSKSEWQALNKSLASEGVELFEKDGLMIFRKLDNIDDLAYMGKLKGWQVSYIDVVKAYNDEVQVYKFTENLSGKTYYLKHTDELEEITRTKRAYDILGNRSDIVHTVKVIEDDQQVLIDFATKHNLPSHKGNYWFIMEEMPSSRTAFNLLEDSSDLGGKPITLAEQEEIINAVKRLNDGGIYHGDLGSNMFFSRDSSGKLRVDIIDYEPWSARDIPKQDLKDVNEMFEVLADVGLAEFRVGENGVVAVKGEDGVIKILTQGSEDLMSSRHVSDIAHKYNKTIDLWTSNNLGYTYYRIYVNNNDNYAAIVADLQRSGYYVSSNKTQDGRYFIAISEQNIFGPWDNSASNWLKANKSVQSSTAGVNQLFLEKLKQYTGYNFIYKSAAESGLKRGHYRLDVSNMSDSEIYAIQNKLRYTGVADKAKIINTNNGQMLVLYEDDMINLGSNMKVSGSMLNNYYGSGAKVDNLQAKVENILNTSYPNEHALRQAWHNSGAWDMNEAYRLTQDLRAGVIRDIKSNPDLANRIRRYNSLSSAEKDQVWIDINYIVGGQNRVHTGKTMIGMVDNYDFAASGQKGFLGAHNGSNEMGHMFRYNRQNLNDFDRMFSTVVHENVHGFQESGRTAINENAWQYRSYNYSRGSTGGYTNQLIEMEARYIQEEASKNFMSELLRNL